MIVKHIAREQITVSDTIIGCDNGGTLFTESVRRRMVYADAQVQKAQLRATFDTTDPVAATTGQLWSAGDIKRIWGITNIENLEMLKESTGDATVVVDYWGE